MRTNNLQAAIDRADKKQNYKETALHRHYTQLRIADGTQGQIDEVPYNKYGVADKNDRTWNGIVFDSKAEMNRYIDLQYFVKSQDIFNLELQPSFLLQEAFTDNRKHKHKAILYIADFCYTEKNGSIIVEDVKGHLTPEYRLKKKLFLYKYPHFVFREIYGKEEQ